MTISRANMRNQINKSGKKKRIVTRHGLHKGKRR